MAVFSDDLNAGQIMTFADLEIVEIVGRGDLHGTGTEGRISVLVSDNRDSTIGERENDFSANEIFVTVIVGIYSDSDVTKESLRASSGDDELGVAVDDFVSDVPEVTLFVFVVDFDVGEGGLVLRAVIDELLAAVDHAVIPHFFEGFVDAGDDVFVEGKGEIGPGAARTEGAELELHIAALLFDKLPDARVEFVAAVFEASMTFFFEGALVDDPSLEAGVVGARDVPGRTAAETVVASKGIFEGDS